MKISTDKKPIEETVYVNCITCNWEKKSLGIHFATLDDMNDFVKKYISGVTVE